MLLLYTICDILIRLHNTLTLFLWLVSKFLISAWIDIGFKVFDFKLKEVLWWLGEFVFFFSNDVNRQCPVLFRFRDWSRGFFSLMFPSLCDSCTYYYWDFFGCVVLFSWNAKHLWCLISNQTTNSNILVYFRTTRPNNTITTKLVTTYLEILHKHSLTVRLSYHIILFLQTCVLHC